MEGGSDSQEKRKDREEGCHKRSLKKRRGLSFVINKQQEKEGPKIEPWGNTRGDRKRRLTCTNCEIMPTGKLYYSGSLEIKSAIITKLR